ncbi:hypothetical protein Cs7R123_72480 [Catellatospora sp. TT07R-123]|nr:hypothetical protein Cs7R123_72480 [Catellatospora sp. TT07R-123]
MATDNVERALAHVESQFGVIRSSSARWAGTRPYGARPGGGSRPTGTRPASTHRPVR